MSPPLILICILTLGAIGSTIARNKGRSGFVWGFLCMVFALLFLPLIIVLPSKKVMAQQPVLVIHNHIHGSSEENTITRMN